MSGSNIDSPGGGGVNLTPSEVRLFQSNGYGSNVGNDIMKWSTINTDTGSALTLTQDNVNGWYITVNVAGWYSVLLSRDFNAAGNLGISLNAANLLLPIHDVVVAQVIDRTVTPSANFLSSVSMTLLLAENDILRAHGDSGDTAGTNNADSQFRVLGNM